MSELVSQDSRLNSDPGRVGVSISPGALIREARESTGVNVDILAAAMKISVDRLDALESDRYEALPDMVFARALASSACRILKVDSAQVLELMPKSQPQSLSISRSDINASFRDGSENQGRNSFLRHFTRPLWVAVIILFLGAGVLLFLPVRLDEAESVVIASERAVLSADVSEINALISSISVDQNLEVATPIILDVLTAGNATDETAVGVAAVDQRVAGDTSIAAHEILKFHAREPTWVQVRDGNKAVLFERILAKGALASVTGAPPLSVVIGRANSTDVFLRGAPFVLSAVAKDNVARFEVE